MTALSPTTATHEPFSRHRMWVVARTDLRQLLRSKDYLLPMVGLGMVFFLVVPTALLLTLTQVDSSTMAARVSDSLEILPRAAQAQIQGSTPGGRTAYALAVFLFAPVAVVVPLTISTAVGAATIVGERERGTGEFLVHSPASTREIYLGKVIASVAPGYATTIVGFGLYSLMVNLVVGPDVGGWFFPTAQWWVMMLWIIPPFLLVALSLVLRLSARVRSTAAPSRPRASSPFP
ncbi:MAG: ABC transporter permease subunit [Microthrixaceae bacterium]